MKAAMHFMSKDLARINCGSCIAEAVDLMRQKGIGSLMVDEQEGNFCGILTERDIITKVDFNVLAKLSSLRVQDIMTTNLITVDEKRPYNDVIVLMQRHKIRHMPVVREEKIIGILSLRDLMRVSKEDLESLLQYKEIQLMETIRKIRQSEEKFRSIFHNSANAIIFANSEGRIINWNPVLEELTGNTAEDLLNKPVQKVFPKEEWEKISPENILRSGGRYHAESRIYNKFREAFDVDISASLLKSADNKISGYIVIMRDIRERKKAENELMRSREKLELLNKNLDENARVFEQIAIDKEEALNELKNYQEQIIQMEKMATLGTLAAGFAHGIKNPLGVIAQGLERIEDILSKQGDESNIKYMDILKNAVSRANDTVFSFLRYSRSSQLEIEEIDIYDIIEEVISLSKDNAKINNVNIRAEFSRINQRMSGDKIMLQQAFINLVNNAINAMPDGGELLINIDFIQSKDAGEESHFILKFKDSGVGIREEILSKIFDPFFTTRDEGQGTGLGLSTVYLIVERHNGKISVESKLNEGTMLTIKLPVEGAQEIKRRHKHV